jgi:hypothetical protein
MRVACPRCKTPFDASDEAVGELMSCPGCETTLRLRAKSAPMNAELPPSAPRPPASPIMVKRPAPTPVAANPTVAQQVADEDNQTYRLGEAAPESIVAANPRREIDDFDEPARPRRRRCRRALRQPPTLPWGYAHLALLAYYAVMLVAALAFRAPSWLVGVGEFLSTMGWLAILIYAFLDDTLEGLLCLFIPVYDFYYVYKTYDTTRDPFGVVAIGFLFQMSGWVLAAFGVGAA